MPQTHGILGFDHEKKSNGCAKVPARAVACQGQCCFINVDRLHKKPAPRNCRRPLGQASQDKAKALPTLESRTSPVFVSLAPVSNAELRDLQQSQRVCPAPEIPHNDKLWNCGRTVFCSHHVRMVTSRSVTKWICVP